MIFNPDIHHRRNLRLKGYDYSQAGAYFVTICTQNRECLFGEIVDGDMHLNDAGQMVQRWFNELPKKFPSIENDAFICMPDHIHAVIVNIDDMGAHTDKTGAHTDKTGAHTDKTGAHTGAPLPGMDDETAPNVGADLRVCPDWRTHPDKTGTHTGAPLPGVVQWFKTMTTNEYIRGVKSQGWRPFTGRLWQRNYYEHIIRNEDSLARIRAYIANNPLQWVLDRENPANIEQGEP